MLSRYIKIDRGDIVVMQGLLTPSRELLHVFSLQEPQATIRVFEGRRLCREYRLETLANNPDLTGQYLHASIRVSHAGAVQIDGVVAHDPVVCPTWLDPHYEAIRFQPFYLRRQAANNVHLRGAGLFQRGLHHAGRITPVGVRCVCVCDDCQRSFSLHHLHAGFADGQYFYSDDSQQTLFVPISHELEMPRPLSRKIEPARLTQLEQRLPLPTVGTGAYRYFNSFRCPHCGSSFIDFHHNAVRRGAEYYGYYFLNQVVQTFH